MMYCSTCWCGTTVIRSRYGRQCFAYAQSDTVLLVTGQSKGDGKIREIGEKWKCCSDKAKGEVERA